MAVMKLTAFNGGMKGKIAGTIFQGGVAGQVVKTKHDWVRRPDGASLVRGGDALVIPWRENWTEVSTEWKNLTAAQQLQWRTSAPSFPFTNKFGDPYTASGYQVFMSINCSLMNSGESMITVCPAPGTVTNSPAFTVIWTAGPHSITISTFTQVAGFNYVLYATANISPGKKPQTSMFKAIMILENPETFPTDITNDYAEVFGTPPNSSNIWFKMVCVNALTGQKGITSVFNLQY